MQHVQDQSSPLPLKLFNFSSLNAPTCGLFNEPIFPSTVQEAISEVDCLNLDERTYYGAIDKEVSRLRLANQIEKTDISVIVHTGIGEKVGDLDPLLDNLCSLGCNVFAPAHPHHYSGADKSKLSTESFFRRSLEATDIGSAIGNTVIVCGASAGSLSALVTGVMLDRAGINSHIICMAPATTFRGVSEAEISILLFISQYLKDSDKIPIKKTRAVGDSHKALATMMRLRWAVKDCVADHDLPHVLGADVHYDPNDAHLSHNAGAVMVNWIAKSIKNLSLSTCSFPLHTKHPNPKEKDWSREYGIVFDQVMREVSNIVKEIRTTSSGQM